MKADQEVLFEESQRFRQWWVWLILFPINLLWIAAVYQQVLQGIPFGDNPMPDTGLFVLAAMCMSSTGFMLSCHLNTKITAQGITVRFFPIQWKFRTYTWNELKSCYIRTYRPLSEYGGWGYRLGIFGRGTAWNVSGNQGLQLEFSDNRKLLIGTQRGAELDTLLKQLGKERKPAV